MKKLLLIITVMFISMAAYAQMDTMHKKRPAKASKDTPFKKTKPKSKHKDSIHAIGVGKQDTATVTPVKPVKKSSRRATRRKAKPMFTQAKKDS